MADPVTLIEIDGRIAAIRENMRELAEQASGFSGAADDERTSERITEQEELLVSLLKQREALASS